MKIGYARISTREQSLQLQVDALKEAGCEKIYQEIASGSKTDRHILDDLMNNIREGDTLIVWKLDRLGRNLKHLLQIIEDLMKKEIGFVSLNDLIDTTTINGKLMFHLIGSFTEFERCLTIERVNAGLKAARARGRLGGRPKGFSEEAEQKSKIAETLYKSETISVKEIARHLKIAPKTVYVYLRHRGVEIGSSPIIKKVITCQS